MAKKPVKTRSKNSKVKKASNSAPSKKVVAGSSKVKRPKARVSTKDRKTLGELVSMADQVVLAARRKRDPHLDIPTRSLSNVKFNRQKRFIENLTDAITCQSQSENVCAG